MSEPGHRVAVGDYRNPHTHAVGLGLGIIPLKFDCETRVDEWGKADRPTGSSLVCPAGCTRWVP